MVKGSYYPYTKAAPVSGSRAVVPYNTRTSLSPLYGRQWPSFSFIPSLGKRMVSSTRGYFGNKFKQVKDYVKRAAIKKAVEIAAVPLVAGALATGTRLYKKYRGFRRQYWSPSRKMWRKSGFDIR